MKILCSFIFLLTTVSTNAQLVKAIKPISTSPASGACCGFRVQNTDALPISLSQAKENTIVYDKKVFDDANAFTNSIAYKAPSDGIYYFTINLGFKINNTSTAITQLMLMIKASSQNSSQLINVPANFNNTMSTETSAIFKLKAGEEISVVVINLGSAAATTTGNINFFSGYKIY